MLVIPLDRFRTIAIFMLSANIKITHETNARATRAIEVKVINAIELHIALHTLDLLHISIKIFIKFN